VRDYAELARLGGVSRARITQIMSLRTLAPVIQEHILALPALSPPADVVNERRLRRVAQHWDWREQMRVKLRPRERTRQVLRDRESPQVPVCGSRNGVPGVMKDGPIREGSVNPFEPQGL
jgi:hypothetical protein